MTIRTCVCWIFALTITVAASGPAEPLALTLQNAFSQAISHNTDIELARLEIDEAAGQVKNVRSGLLPHLNGLLSAKEQQRSSEIYGFTDAITTSGQIVGPNGQISEVTITADPDDTIGPYSSADAEAILSMAILNLEVLHTLRASRANLDLHELALEFVTEDVLAGVATVYNRALFSAQAVAAMHQSLAFREERLRLMRDAQTAGTVTELDVGREALKLSMTRRELKALENEDAAARRELARLLALDPGTCMTLTSSLPFRPIRLNRQDHTLDVALARRPDYLSQQQAERVAEHLADAAHAGRWPRLTLSGNVGMQGKDFSDVVDVWGIGAGVDIPLWDSFQTAGQIDQADSQLAQQRTRTAALVATIGNEIDAASDDLDLREQAIAVAREAVAVATSALMSVRDSASAGEKTPLDVLQAQMDLADAELDEIKAVQGYHTACIEWFKAVGDVQLYALVVSER